MLARKNMGPDHLGISMKIQALNLKDNKKPIAGTVVV
jgi:hypothetical protein